MNQVSDQLSIDTPELVTIEMPLAGVGSRFIALLIDGVVWFAAILVLLFLSLIFLPAIRAASALSEKWAVALIIFIFFLLNWGYFTLFEAFWNGQTPGKRIARIRVIQRTGRPIGIVESMARNFVRYVDYLPSFYVAGVITMFVTKQHQRLGDLAAGTLVVRDRTPESPLWNDAGSRTFTAASFTRQPAIPEPHLQVSLPATGIAKLASTDLEVLESFFARRLDMPLEVRQNLAGRIAAALQAKSGLEPPPGVSTETFLEAIGRDLRDQARLR
ncbi:RDD family protein [Acidobacteria bacterium AB60]|nr:RDD family protein [Acidobacteria bacterium AB60]